MRFDIIYMLGEGYYKRKVLEKLCKQRNITVDDFIKYFSNNPKHYKFNKKALDESDKGSWIGLCCKIPDEYLIKNLNEI